MSKKEEKLVIMNEGKEIEFVMSDLSDEAKAQYSRANELAGQLMQIDRQANAIRYLDTHYIIFDIDELKTDLQDREATK